MAKRWSKLQSRLYRLIDPALNFQIHCAVYEMNSNDGWHGNKLPRYFITIGKEIVFDYPKDFDTTWEYGYNAYPWKTDMDRLSELIADYIQCSEADLMKAAEGDRWGLTDILRVCDRRIGKRRLQKLKDSTTNETLLKIIDKRLHGR